jgi:hypothetical protein
MGELKYTRLRRVKSRKKFATSVNARRIAKATGLSGVSATRRVEEGLVTGFMRSRRLPMAGVTVHMATVI